MKINKLYIPVAIAILALIMWAAWLLFLAPTKIAIVNYPITYLRELAKANNNPYIKLAAFDDENIKSIAEYDMVFINGMTLKITEEQRESVLRAVDSHVSIITTNASNPLNDISTVDSLSIAKITAYMANGGVTNNRNMLNYVRRHIDKKIISNFEIGEPIEKREYLISHPNLDDPDSDDVGFNSIKEYNKYLEDHKLYNEDAPRVIVVGKFGEPSQVVLKLAESGNMVYPFHVMTLEPMLRSGVIDSIAPSLVVDLTTRQKIKHPSPIA